MLKNFNKHFNHRHIFNVFIQNVYFNHVNNKGLILIVLETKAQIKMIHIIKNVRREFFRDCIKMYLVCTYLQIVCKYEMHVILN